MTTRAGRSSWLRALADEMGGGVDVDVLLLEESCVGGLLHYQECGVGELVGGEGSVSLVVGASTLGDDKLGCLEHERQEYSHVT